VNQSALLTHKVWSGLISKRVQQEMFPVRIDKVGERHGSSKLGTIEKAESRMSDRILSKEAREMPPLS
jgi:hypothetical protein